MSFLLSKEDVFSRWLQALHQKQAPLKGLNAESLLNAKHQPVSGRRGLNVISRYANHKSPSVREQVQNWRDQCVTLAEERSAGSFSFDTIQVHIYSSGNSKGYMLYSTISNHLLGYVLCLQQGDQLQLEFCNYATVLHHNILQFGRTSKESKTNLAGNFGEGMKVEINRLLAENASISIYTGSAIWKFLYFEDELSVEYFQNPTPITNTHIVMKNVPLAAKIDPSHYLFFQTQYIKKALVNAEFIFSHHLCNRIYLLGIFVMETKKDLLPKIGLNIVDKNVSKIGRDRSHLTDYNIVSCVLSNLNLMPFLKECGHRGNQKTDCENCTSFQLLSLFYNFIKGECNFIWNSIPIEYARIPEHFMDIFLACEPPNSIPVSKAEFVVQHSDAKLLRLNLVCCSKPLVNLLRKSKRCPTLEKAVQSKSKDFLLLPELISTAEEIIPYPVSQKTLLPPDYQIIGGQIRAMGSAVFKIDPRQIRFKDCHECAKENSTKIIKVKMEETPFYLFDFRYFVVDAVHAESQRCEPDFNCIGRCGCVITFAFNHLLSTMQPANPERFRNKAMRLAMGSISPDITSTTIPTVSISIPKPFIEQKEKKTNSLSPGRIRPPDSNAHISPEEYKERSKHIATTCVSITGNLPPVKTLSGLTVTPSTDIPNLEAWVCQKPDKLVYFSRSFCGHLPFAESSSSESPPQMSCAFRLAEVIYLLAQSVFKKSMNLDKSIPQISTLNIFYERSTTMAFNLSSRLFFNCYYYDTNASQCELYSFWFSIYCHELAHNVESSHNSRHSATMTNLHTKYLPCFAAFCYKK